MPDIRAVSSGPQVSHRLGAAGLSVEEVLSSLRGRFGDWHEESYEHGKREFGKALAESFDWDADDAVRVVEELEQAQVIRFHGGPSKDDPDGPHIGLFDEPHTVPRGEPAVEPPARGWEIGRDQQPGVSS